MLPKCGDGLAKLQKLLFRVAHSFHEDVPVPSALAPKATHDFGEILLQVLSLVHELRGLAPTSLRDAGHQFEGFFCALYSVVASVTRWLPCSHGKVSTTRWAGLTSPSSIAAAA